MGSPPAHVPRRLKRGRHENDRRAHSLDMALLEEMYWRQLRITQVYYQMLWPFFIAKPLNTGRYTEFRNLLSTMFWFVPFRSFATNFPKQINVWCFVFWKCVANLLNKNITYIYYNKFRNLVYRQVLRRLVLVPYFLGSLLFYSHFYLTVSPRH